MYATGLRQTYLIYNHGSMRLRAYQNYRPTSGSHVQIFGRRDVILYQISEGEALNAPTYLD